MILISYISCLLAINIVRADTEGQRNGQDPDFYAPNSVPMMGKKSGKKFYFQHSLIPVPMLRLKKEEKESPFIYKTPWHIGKRAPWYYGKRAEGLEDLEQVDKKVNDTKRSATASDIYSASWIGSLFKPSLPSENINKNKRFRFLEHSSFEPSLQENNVNKNKRFLPYNYLSHAAKVKGIKQKMIFEDRRYNRKIFRYCPGLGEKKGQSIF